MDEPEVWTVFRLSDNAVAGSFDNEAEANALAARRNSLGLYANRLVDPELWIVSKGEKCDPNIYGPDPPGYTGP